MPVIRSLTDVHVLADEVLTFTSNGDENCFIILDAPRYPGTMTPSGPFASLVNEGEIRFTSSDHISSYLVAYEIYYGGGSTITNHGLMRLDAIDGSGGLIGPASANPTVRNHGQMIVNAEVDAQIIRDYWIRDFVNTGTMTVTGGGYVSGLISLFQTQLTNSGTISVTSTERSAWAVSMGYGDSDSWVINSGLITAQATGEIGYSVGVSMGSAYEDVLLENTGTIRAQYSVSGGGESFDGQHIIRNSGLLDGDVLLGDSRADILNTGTIIGNISLGGSADLFDSRGGLLVGDVAGEDGDDIIYSGSASDRVHGGEGADWLDGGEGDNVLRGGNGDDVLIGGAGHDQFDGGADFDIVDYSNSAAGVTVDMRSTAVQETGGAGSDVLVKIEGVRGSEFADSLHAASRYVDNPGRLTKDEGTENQTIASAVSLDGLFALRDDMDVDDALTSPHVVVTATNSGAQEFYRFTVTAAGEAGRFDIDHVDYSWNLRLRLYDAAGNLIHENFEGPPDVGSTSPADPYLLYTFATPGVYYIAVNEQTLMPLNPGVKYTLNVALSNAPVVGAHQVGSSLWGNGGDDILFGSDRSDLIDGGAGEDVLVVSSTAANYRLLRNGDAFILKGPDGGDHLTSVESIRFGDGRVLELNRMYGPGVDARAWADGRIPEALLSGDGAEADETLVLPRVTDPGLREGKDGGRPEVLPGPLDDDFLIAKDAGEPQVMPMADLEADIPLDVRDIAVVLLPTAGDDVLMGGGGADTLSGGGGVDTADYSGAAGGVRADLLAGVASNDGDGSADVLTLIEDLIGSAFNDVLAGSHGANALTGGDGRDVLKGQGGDDVLTGGRGDDTLSGGGGANDVAVMSGVRADYTVTALAAAGSYRITDGVAGRDGVDSLSLVEWVRFSDGSTVRVSDMVGAAPLEPEAKSAAAFVMPGLEDDAFLVGKAELSAPLVLPTDVSDPFLPALGEAPGFQAAAGNWMANLVDSGEPAWRPMDDDAWLGRPGEDLWQ